MRYLLVLFLTIGFCLLSAPIGTISAVEGVVQIGGIKSYEKALETSSVYSGSKVRSAAASSVEISLRDGSVIFLGEASVLRFLEKNENIFVILESGKALCKTVSIAVSTPFALISSSEAPYFGVAYEVSRSESRVAVFEGQLRVETISPYEGTKDVRLINLGKAEHIIFTTSHIPPNASLYNEIRNAEFWGIDIKKTKHYKPVFIDRIKTW